MNKFLNILINIFLFLVEVGQIRGEFGGSSYWCSWTSKISTMLSLMIPVHQGDGTTLEVSCLHSELSIITSQNFTLQNV